MAYPSAPTNEVDPVSRIEGHLGIAVTVNGSNVVTEAHAHGNLWRGFENFLLGREPNDAITFTQRICGVCPVPHGMTATYAADTVLGFSKGHITFAQGTGTGAAVDSYGVPPKAVVIRNLVLGCEFLMSSITHFYHLVAPSYVQGPPIAPWTPYFDVSQYNPLLAKGAADVIPQRGTDGTYSKDLWSTVIRSYVRALRIRRLTFEGGALFAGRMPMTSCYVAGGVTYDGTEDLVANGKIAKFRTILTEVGLFVIQEYVPIVLALGALYPNYDNPTNAATANSVPDIAPTPPATGGVGAGVGRFLAWGAFPQTDAAGSLGAVGGYYDASDPTNANGKNFQVTNKLGVYNNFLTGGTWAVPTHLTEDIAWSRYKVGPDTAAYGANTYAYPGAVTRTNPLRSNGYTYMKAPRWKAGPSGASVSAEVGPFARLVVAGLYPVDGVTAFLNPAGNALQQFYSTYTYTDTGGTGATGLDPRMIYPDIAVALVREGLATLVTSLDNGLTITTATSLNINTLTATQINTGYSYANAGSSVIKRAYIQGDILSWAAALVGGLSTIDRIRGRAFESAVLVQNMLGAYSKVGGAWTVPAGNSASYAGSFTGGWIADSSLALTTAGSTWRSGVALPALPSSGWGANEAPRGALMHQCTIGTDAKISRYQCIVPTTWNGSPKDSSFVAAAPGDKHLYRGPIEQACVGAPFAPGTTAYLAGNGVGAFNAATGGVEVVRCAQSFDPCIACAVH